MEFSCLPPKRRQTEIGAILGLRRPSIFTQTRLLQRQIKVGRGRGWTRVNDDANQRGASRVERKGMGIHPCVNTNHLQLTKRRRVVVTISDFGLELYRIRNFYHNTRALEPLHLKCILGVDLWVRNCLSRAAAAGGARRRESRNSLPINLHFLVH